MTPVFPLGNAFLPGDAVVLRVFEPRFLELIDTVLGSDEPSFVTVLIERGSEVGGGDRRFGTGVRVRIESVQADQSGLTVIGSAGPVVIVDSWGPDDPYPRAEVHNVQWGQETPSQRRDCASALTLLAQSVRTLLARHGVGVESTEHPRLAGLATVAAGHWFSPDVQAADVELAYWTVARCVPCGPLDRHLFLCAGSASDGVRTLRSVVEHTDEILSFGLGHGQ